MDNINFEKEINTRVEFKLLEIKDKIESKIKKHANLSYAAAIQNEDNALSIKEMHFKTAYLQLFAIFKEVTEKLLPSNNMTELENRNKKQIIVKSITDKFDSLTYQKIRLEVRSNFISHVASCVDKLLM